MSSDPACPILAREGSDAYINTRIYILLVQLFRSASVQVMLPNCALVSPHTGSSRQRSTANTHEPSKGSLLAMSQQVRPVQVGTRAAGLSGA